MNCLIHNQLLSIQRLCDAQGVQLVSASLAGLGHPAVGKSIDAEHAASIINHRELSFEFELNECSIKFYVISQDTLSINMSKPLDSQQVITSKRRKGDDVTSVNPDLQFSSENLILSFENEITPWILSIEALGDEQQSSPLQGSLLFLLSSVFSSIPILLAKKSAEQTSSLYAVSALNSRASFLQTVNELSQENSMAMSMIHCQSYERSTGNLSEKEASVLLSQIADEIQSVIREQDQVLRLSNTIFTVALLLDSEKEAQFVSNKITQHLEQKFNGPHVLLDIKVGISFVDDEEPNNDDIDKATVLFTRAEQALNAAIASDNTALIVWDRMRFTLNEEQFGYLGGIFTSDSVSNYRNMLLLWDVTSIIADQSSFERLIQLVIQRLVNTFDFKVVGLWQKAASSFCFSIDAESQVQIIQKEQLSVANEIQACQATLKTPQTFEKTTINGDFLYLIPLEQDPDMCFFIQANKAKFVMTQDAEVLLKGIIRQIEKAHRRCQLESELNERLTAQNSELVNELSTLKQGLSSTALIYQSTQMEKVVKQTKRAAMADTTILVTGESGTGKERLIHAIHKLGPRSEKPIVIVDCGSIPETLIESELFGYVKGAFTGAQKNAIGKVEEADGGILVLDEIGELPLSMQPKLLRFVQEKHFSPVGDAKLRKVDVKIVAVTNRDLEKEVEYGNFRKDLYFRLNVVTLKNPPLRERKGDVALLAQHFLNKFSKQFEVDKKYLSRDTLQAMEAYQWPGNIRELENKLMQAVLLSEDTEITIEQLELSDSHHLLDSSQVSSSHEDVKKGDVGLIEVIQSESQEYDSSKNILENISDAVSRVCQEVTSSPKFLHFCIGNLIEIELLLLCYQSVEGNVRLLSTRLGVPASTARRRINKLLLEITSNSASERPDSWYLITQYLKAIADGEVVVPDTFNNLKLAVLKGLLAQGLPNMSMVAGMLGVSEPTLYKLKKKC